MFFPDWRTPTDESGEEELLLHRRGYWGRGGSRQGRIAAKESWNK